MRPWTLAVLALVVAGSSPARAAHDGATSPCCRAATIGPVGSSCDPIGPDDSGLAGCIEDPNGSGTCIGGDFLPPLARMIENGDSVQEILDECLPVEGPPDETPEEKLQRVAEALRLCGSPTVCFCIGDGQQVGCIADDRAVSQPVCTRRAVRACCAAGACHGAPEP